MGIGSELEIQFRETCNTHGIPIAIGFFTQTYTAADYDVETNTASGTNATGSCMWFPVGNSTDEQYLTQGIIELDDIKVLLPSGIAFSGNSSFVLRAGSYMHIKSDRFDLDGAWVYSRLYLRRRNEP